jgi:hypothetical protein
MNDEPRPQFPRNWLRGKFGVFPGRIVTELAPLVVANDPVVEIVVRNNVNGRNHRENSAPRTKMLQLRRRRRDKDQFRAVRENCAKLTIIRATGLAVEFLIPAWKPIRGFCPRCLSKSRCKRADCELRDQFAFSCFNSEAVLAVPATSAASR